ncbi:uncharacterized protein LOC120416053 [Culex pipiens pallens]|uniref:uncharacterized protein LOC120416053 n=1 Tax=Culex pipiens pallens TaxID=42434 RepID=UPI001952E3EC|nr:uncharacterized protein LOC120416053 [Culex pipiens pallens]
MVFRALVLFSTVLVIESFAAETRILSVTQCQGECTTEGIICSDSSTVSYCILNGGQWREIPFDSCNTEEGFFCNKQDGGCSQRIGPCHPENQEGVFVCSSEGVFPNPFDCRTYHMCYVNAGNMVSIQIQCQNSAFSPTTNQCSLSLDHEVCLEPQWSCERAGDIGGWPGTDNLYYICVNTAGVLSPRLFRCDPNHVFEEGRCVEGSSDTTNSPGGFQCQSPGLSRDPSDCTRYFYCDMNLDSQHLQCPVGTIFDVASVSCVRGTC